MLPTRARPTERTPPASWLAVVLAALLVGGCALLGWWLTQRGVRLHLGNTFPVVGRYDLHLSAWLVGPLLVAAAVWWVGPRLAFRLRWGTVLVASYLTAVGWALALARVGGPDAIAHPLTHRWEYLAEVDRIDQLGVVTYLATFTDFIVAGEAGPGWANHVAGHPPLITLLFVLLARAGLAGPGWAAALCVAAGAAAVPAVLSTVRLLAGAFWARAAAPFVAAAPVALWVATSADAIIAGVAATGVAALAHAAARRGVPAVALAAAGGLLLGGTLLLSYGAALLAPLAVAVVVAVRGWRASWEVLAVAAVAVTAVLAGFAAAGFWWLEGLGLTAHRVRIGEGWSDRPTWYFGFNNPAALAVAVGPAVVAALPLAWRLRPWIGRWAGTPTSSAAARLALPAAMALGGLALALLSNMSKGEVERIWLPWAMWLLPLAALLPQPTAAPDPASAVDRPPTARGWLAAHLSWPIVVELVTTLAW